VKAFLDTNVWLAGRLGSGLCAELLEALIEANVGLLVDERVLAEFRRIAKTKFRIDQETLVQADIFFLRFTQCVPAADHPIPGIPDPDDALIISAALAAGADFFVTGDKALLDLGEVQGMPILDVRTAYLRLRGLG
jgi:putative PIN family toxin of toxin-antitoxin system